MKKIKDFIYDYNDVLVAILIVAAAAVIIFWRVNTVMDYASIVASEPVKSIDIDFSDIDLTQKEVEDSKDADVEPERPDDNTQTTPVEPQPTTPEEQTPTADPVPETPVEPEKPTIKTYKMVVSAAEKTKNWTAVGQKLQENGIIEDYKTFVARVTVRKDDRRLQVGTFEVNSGMTIDQIIDKLIGK